MDQMMNNPQMMAMAQAMMQDPEVMEMMQRPGMMEKLQGAMSNPASAMGDPDVMKIIMKLQGMQGGGGGGGGGFGGFGGAGGYGGAPAPSAGGSGGGAADIRHIRTGGQLDAIHKEAGARLVVVDYFTTWCGPCKAIAPLFSQLASTWKDKVLFVKVDGDQSRELCQEKGVQGFPTFEFYIGGSKIESFAGADSRRLQSLVEEHGEAASQPAKVVCPYKHFPLKESELVKYPEMKWEMVTPKFREFNAKFDAGSAHLLSEAELTTLDAFLKTVQDRASYHNSTVSPEQFQVLLKLLNWPKENIGPVVNTVRMAVMHPGVAKFFADASLKANKDADMLPTLIKIANSADKAVTAMLVVRTLANCFNRRALGKAYSLRFEDVFEAMAGLYRKYSGDENLKLSVIALYINYAIMFQEDPSYYEAGKVLLMTNVQEVLQADSLDAKVMYRAVVILGTLVYLDKAATELARDLDVLDAVASAAKKESCAADQQTQQVAQELKQCLTSQ